MWLSLWECLRIFSPLSQQGRDSSANSSWEKIDLGNLDLGQVKSWEDCGLWARHVWSWNCWGCWRTCWPSFLEPWESHLLNNTENSLCGPLSKCSLLRLGNLTQQIDPRYSSQATKHVPQLLSHRTCLLHFMANLASGSPWVKEVLQSPPASPSLINAPQVRSAESYGASLPSHICLSYYLHDVEVYLIAKIRNFSK